VSRRIRQVLSTGATLALVVTLANCADAPTSTLTPPSGPSLAQGSAANAQDGDDVVPGEIIVGLKSDADAPGLAREHGLGVGAAGYANAYRILTVTAGNERAMAARLAADPRVAYAEPNYIRHVEAIDDRLWAFFNPGGLNMKYTSGGTGSIPNSYASFADADEDAIAGIGSGGAVVVIGSIDTGVDFTHPEFESGQLIAGCDWFKQVASRNTSATCANGNFAPNDTPDEGHGTHTTGTMVGKNVGVAGVTGAGSNVKVFVQRVCGPPGCYTSAIVNAIRAGADYPGMVALNLSLGGNSESSAEKEAIAYATSKNVLVIASAGNSGSGKVGCPACDPNAISVAATTWQDKLAAYSQSGSGLDISAPGGYCYSNTTPEGCVFSAVVKNYSEGAIAGPIVGASYAYMMGTSMAAPQVTGAAGVVASKTALRGAALRSRLQSTADDLGASGYDTKFGNGRLNVYRAVTGTSLPAGQ
jgi:serine protease